MTRIVLASASRGRREVLRQAGIDPEIRVADVDEEALAASHEEVLDPLPPLARAEATTCLLATAKARTVAAHLGPVETPTLIIGADSLLLLGEELQGKPHTAERARERWLAQRGATAHLVTGHALILIGNERGDERSAAATTELRFADLSDDEIDAYVATGEPLEVAGAFTLDGLGAPYVTHLVGDYHNVIGLSLALTRRLAADMGVFWPSLWPQPAK
ncbi:septum formation inhibitor Maf [Nanchangia anserum]|uniref:Nucleoside triphosphate pyrophosphatase n=1 Tax=Nanchangia anserum TaxID=2692125 RepID=A0A8I0KWK8_9ACTO|nr:Maf family protein [Nanchangia anserum]MBD3690099.1 septum formation inhibitor Maf [Nanchangia anserum]QOX82114.1 septum formation inhibitor Maf [Nanchangia anserum]